MNRLISNGSILVMYTTKNVPYQTVYTILGIGLPSIALLINTLLFRHKVIMNKKKHCKLMTKKFVLDNFKICQNKIYTNCTVKI